MKVGIYTPYLNSFGGGERYMLTLAEVLSLNYSVELLLDSHLVLQNPQKLKIDLGKRFDLDLSKTEFIKAPLGRGSSVLERLLFLRRYDLFFYLTDGSVFYSTAKKNVLHFQVPFKNLEAENLWGRIKLKSWNTAICNSKFTLSFIAKNWQVNGRVIYPPVDVEKIKPLSKKKYILSVGRFASFSKSKKHEEIIRVFNELFKTEKISDWSLHLAGSLEGEEKYIEELRKMAENTPVFFYPNCSFEKLVKLYGEASIYWHASGFGEDDPAKMEHFGITTVEAMAGGCVPVVINKGGQPEIVEHGKSGFLWEGLIELKELTLKLMGDPKLMLKLSKNAIERCQLFSKKHFEDEINKLLLSIYGK